MAFAAVSSGSVYVVHLLTLAQPVATQVDEMEKAVDVAEKNMARFGLTQQEISNRRKWVLQTRRQVGC